MNDMNALEDLLNGAAAAEGDTAVDTLDTGVDSGLDSDVPVGLGIRQVDTGSLQGLSELDTGVVDGRRQPTVVSAVLQPQQHHHDDNNHDEDVSMWTSSSSHSVHCSSTSYTTFNLLITLFLLYCLLLPVSIASIGLQQ